MFMKKEIPLSKANRLINAGGVILVTSAYKGRTNIVTLAWHAPMSHTPPFLGICVAKGHLTSEFIKKRKAFVINVPDAGLLDEVMVCGSHSGREVDKFSKTGLTPIKSRHLAGVPLIEECIGHIECRLKRTVEVGDHYVFVGEPVAASAKEGSFNEVWDVRKVKLLFHLGGGIFTTSTPKTLQP
jgi:flavin reductase (DIM6/NTAB) family NADH-FMN oxidoreductase RutF